MRHLSWQTSPMHPPDPDMYPPDIPPLAYSELEAVANLLLFGGPEARRHMAEDLAIRQDRSIWRLLLATVDSAEPWRLRARSLEMLGLVAGCAKQEMAEEILRALCDSQRPEPHC